MDAFVNAQSLMTAKRAFIFSCIIFALWMIIELYLRKAPLTWCFSFNKFQALRIKGLGRAVQMKIVGAILLIWLPSFVDALTPKEEYISSLFLKLGKNDLLEGEIYYVLYGLGDVKTKNSVIFLPLALGNQSNKSIRKISISVLFPNHSGFVVPHSNLNQEIMGSYKDSEMTIRTNETDRFSVVTIFLDRLDPNIAVLKVPINWPSNYFTTKNLEIEHGIPVWINVTAEDDLGLHFNLQLRAFREKSPKGVSNLYRTTLSKAIHFFEKKII